MAHINLLPWRETKRKGRKRQFGFYLVGVAILAGAAVLYWHMLVQQQIQHQRSRNALLNVEIKKVNKKIKEIKNIDKRRAQLIGRMNVIQGLQVSRPQIVHLFDELVSSIPAGVYLTSLVQKDNRLTIKGNAQSNARVSAYMRNIDNSIWIGRAGLKIVQNKRKGAGMSQFTLSATQLNPNVKPKAKKKKKKKKKRRK